MCRFAEKDRSRGGPTASPPILLYPEGSDLARYRFWASHHGPAELARSLSPSAPTVPADTLMYMCVERERDLVIYYQI